MSTITKERVAEIIHAAGLEPCDYEAVFESIKTGEIVAMARIALASLEAEPVAWLLSGGGAKNNVSFDSGNAYADPLREVTPLYTAPPAPVSVPAAMEMDDDFDSAFEHGKAVGWNAYRAAMLQVAEPVTTAYKLPEGWVAVPVEPTAEMISSGIAAHYKRNQIQIHDRPAPGPMECAYVAMLAAAPQQEAKNV
ncbi:hypothetical protein V1569_17450 [Enterobacter bugandensis]